MLSGDQPIQQTTNVCNIVGGADTLLRVNGTATTVTDDGGDGKGHFFDEGTLRTNIALQIIRRLNSGVIQNDGSPGTIRYGKVLAYSPALATGRNRFVERWLAWKSGIALA